MRIIVLFLIMAAALVTGASGYIVEIEAPEKVQAGAPLLVTGSTSFPAGTELDLVLYRLVQPVPETIERRILTVDQTKTFSESFSTLGLESGQYKVEISFPSNKGDSLGSGSTTVRLIDIIDRSDEIHLAVRTDQPLGEALNIKGYLLDFGVGTITIRVTGPGEFSAPSMNIRTTTKPGGTDGHFSRMVPVTEPGNYYVTFSDAGGHIATIKFTVAAAPVTTRTTVAITEEVTEEPAPTFAALPYAGILGGILLAAMFLHLRRK